jgi:hypothetical protein
MKKVFNIIFLLFLMIFAVSIYSYGQGYRTFRQEMEQIVKETRWQFGPFRIHPTFRFTNVGYDNNVYYQQKEEGPVSDFTATLSPEVKVHLLFRNYIILTLTENPEYVYYLEQGRERRWNNTLSPEFKLLFLRRFVISGSYSYRNRRRRASSEFDVRANEHIESYEGSLFYETPRGTAFGISALSERISYEDITFPGEEIYLSRRLNRKERSGNFEFYYRVFSETFFFVTGGYTEYNFEHPESQWRNSYSFQYYGGVHFPLLGKVRGTLSLGYKNHTPRSERKKSFEGLVGNTSLDFRVGRFNFRLEYDRDNYFSYWSESVFFIADRYGAGISFYLTRFLKLDYDYSYGKSNYPELTTIVLPDGRAEKIYRKDLYRTHSVGLVFRIMGNTGIGLVINFWDRDSNYYLEDRDRMFVGGYVTYEF